MPLEINSILPLTGTFTHSLIDPERMAFTGRVQYIEEQGA